MSFKYIILNLFLLFIVSMLALENYGTWNHTVELVPDKGVVAKKSETRNENLPMTVSSKKPASIQSYISIAEKNNQVELKVQDNGIGISDEDIKKIYDPFYRVESSRNKNLGGLGLGLNISNEIVKLHNAVLSVDSKLGSGTTFICIFHPKSE